MAEAGGNHIDEKTEKHVTDTEDKHPPSHRVLAIKVTLIVLILTLSASTAFLYLENQNLKKSLTELTTKTAILQSYALGYDTNATVQPPVSKLQAVMLALQYGHWNSTSLSGMRVNASIRYYEHITTERGGSFKLSYINTSVSDYSQKIEHNVTIPRTDLGSGTLIGRYVWAVDIVESGYQRYYRWPSYMVDVNTGEVFFFRPPTPGGLVGSTVPLT
jgi:hypothetical protein